MRRKFDEQSTGGTMLTGHCSKTDSPPVTIPTNSVWQFPIDFLWQFLPLISLVAAKNGRSCWRSPTCRNASTCRRRWSRTRTTTSSTSSPSGRFSFGSSAKTASKWFQSDFCLKQRFLGNRIPTTTTFWTKCTTTKRIWRKTGFLLHIKYSPNTSPYPKVRFYFCICICICICIS